MAKGSGSFGAAFGSWYFNTSRIVLKQCGYQFSGMPTCFQMSSKLELWKKKEMNDTNILASLRIHVVLSFGCKSVDQPLLFHTLSRQLLVFAVCVTWEIAGL